MNNFLRFLLQERGMARGLNDDFVSFFFFPLEQSRNKTYEFGPGSIFHKLLLVYIIFHGFKKKSYFLIKRLIKE